MRLYLIDPATMDEEDRLPGQSPMFGPIGMAMRVPGGAAPPPQPAGPMAQPIAPGAPAGSAMTLPPISMPTPQRSALETLASKASGIHNPFARLLAETGTGLLRGADAAAESILPGPAMLIPGSTLGTAAKNNRAMKTAETENTEQTEREKANTGATEANTEQQRAATDAEKQQWQENNPSGPKLKSVETDKDGNAIGVFEDGTTKPLGFQGAPEKKSDDAFHEWLASNPNGTYDQFLKDTQQYKGAPQRMTGMGAYALMRIIDAASRYDPRLEPLIPALTKELGIDANLDLSGAPAGQPRNDSGQPIGLSMPEAPTSSTRSRGQFAESGVSDQIPGLKQEINSMRDQLGPVSGRWNEFMAGKVGANNPKFVGLRTGLDNLATAWMRLHANSEGARQEFENMLSRAKTPDDLIATLDAIGKQASDYVRQGKGNQPAGPKTGEVRMIGGKPAHWDGHGWLPGEK